MSTRKYLFLLWPSMFMVVILRFVFTLFFFSLSWFVAFCLEAWETGCWLKKTVSDLDWRLDYVCLCDFFFEFSWSAGLTFVAWLGLLFRLCLSVRFTFAFLWAAGLLVAAWVSAMCWVYVSTWLVISCSAWHILCNLLPHMWLSVLLIWKVHWYWLLVVHHWLLDVSR